MKLSLLVAVFLLIGNFGNADVTVADNRSHLVKFSFSRTYDVQARLESSDVQTHTIYTGKQTALVNEDGVRILASGGADAFGVQSYRVLKLISLSSADAWKVKAALDDCLATGNTASITLDTSIQVRQNAAVECK